MRRRDFTDPRPTGRTLTLVHRLNGSLPYSLGSLPRFGPSLPSLYLTELVNDLQTDIAQHRIIMPTARRERIIYPAMACFWLSSTLFLVSIALLSHLPPSSAKAHILLFEQPIRIIALISSAWTTLHLIPPTDPCRIETYLTRDWEIEAHSRLQHSLIKSLLRACTLKRTLQIWKQYSQSQAIGRSTPFSANTKSATSSS